MENENISSIDLMERAASIATFAILSTYHFKNTLILCGPGNNGGDGYAIARLLNERGFTVSVLECDAPKSMDCIENHKKLPKELKRITANDSFDAYDLIIDAMFGNGFKGATRNHYCDIIQKANNCSANIVAIDTPSGLEADLISQTNPHIITADFTITFEQAKRAFFFAENEKYLGKVRVVSIGLSEKFDAVAWAEMITPQSFTLQSRKEFTHKGENGRLLIVGGFDKMAGASILATKAAFRSGAGYVFNYCSEFTEGQILNHCHEAIISNEFPDNISAISIGMGLGQSSSAQEVLIKTLDLGIPLVIDADAINIIAEQVELKNNLPKNSILTPHLGELKRLLGTDNNDPEFLLKSQVEFSMKHRVYVLHKGKFSKITTPLGEIYVNPTGNPGMAVAGSGDVLSGIIGSFLAQGNSPETSVKAGVFIHGLAADICKKDMGEIGMLPSDYLERIPEAIEQSKS